MVSRWCGSLHRLLCKLAAFLVYMLSQQAVLQTQTPILAPASHILLCCTTYISPMWEYPVWNVNCYAACRVALLFSVMNALEKV
jgi:hypothetical protein